MKIKLIVLIFFIAIVVFSGVCLMLYKKVESRDSKLNEYNYVIDQYGLLINDIIAHKEFGDSLKVAVGVNFDVGRLNEGYVILKPKEGIKGDFYGFYILVDSMGQIKESGLHKP